jgi:hypothetical protein
MIIAEPLRTREDGTILIRTYSDSGYMVERDGVMYDEAIDPIEFGREYIETNVKRESSDFQDATEQDYQNALAEMGVELNG